jgi:membrane-bound metal-dependent hydrolase YbcI (DUF457 family)
MQTYSHLLITALLNEGLQARGIAADNRALILGSFMPDLPLFALSLGYLAARRRDGSVAPEDRICGPRFNTLYFHNPLWITGHNLFHAPIHLALIALIGFGLRRRKKWGPALVWFAAACGLHSLIDIITHYDDGPLPLFPFNRTYRFRAPISYWDADHGGRFFAPFEHLLNLAIGLYLGTRWLKNHRKSSNYQNEGQQRPILKRTIALNTIESIDRPQDHKNA